MMKVKSSSPSQSKVNNLFFVLHGSQLWLGMAGCVFQRELQKYPTYSSPKWSCHWSIKRWILSLHPNGIWARLVTALTNRIWKNWQPVLIVVFNYPNGFQDLTLESKLSHKKYGEKPNATGKALEDEIPCTQRHRSRRM